ncbi:MAG: protein TolB [bacterium]|nr:MAG: protein TolB [bacterium]
MNIWRFILVSRSKQTARILAIGLAAYFFSVTCLFAVEVYIDVERKRGGLTKIAVSEFFFSPSPAMEKPNEPLGKRARDILEFDLMFSGYFRLVTEEYASNGAGGNENSAAAIDWEGLKELEADAFIKGLYQVDHDGGIIIEAWLYDVETGGLIIGMRYTGERKLFRKMVHRFADEVVYRLSGEPGIAETRLAFISRVKGRKELFICDYEGFGLEQVTSYRSIVLSPEWSPSGESILFTSYRNGNPDIFSLDLQSGTTSVISQRKGLNSSAAWSPDGKKIALTISVKGNSDIYIVNADGRRLRRLTFASSIETSPTFSPDGKRIAYTSDFPGTPQIYIMDANGRRPKRFTFSGNYNAEPAWSPKGDKIAYVGLNDENFNIFVKNVGGRSEKQLTAYMGTNEQPSWSPDGRNIAFSSTRSGTRQIYIMNENGEHQMRVTNLKGGGYSPSWSRRE